MSVIELFMGDVIVKTNSLLFFLVVLAVTMMLGLIIIRASRKIRVLKLAF